MKLEVIVTRVDEALIADQSGADRIELVSGILEGGLTPSCAMIEEVVNAVGIPVNVMVRPHSQSFRYSAGDRKVMAKDIEHIRKVGANGIVIGVLSGESTIDEYALQWYLDCAEHLEVTFHRAFDELANQEASVNTLLKYPQITRLLTSGGKSNVNDAADRVKKFVELTKGTHLTVMAGSGLRVETLRAFVEKTGVKEVHFGTGARIDLDPLKNVDAGRIINIKKVMLDIGM
ncbi:copper homeostasis protein [Cohnella kolymensis]|uniref:PF03932 family protein CutC n=1 Tax=Cohnella kolymensis TaxID=1590652 RepID=A0ABR5A9J0_9BACL|nr:copper homeostasis protein CutC [Cohnella kolymensis]KIL37674.1 copper homeostasis protein [Cohnella kolymensis]